MIRVLAGAALLGVLWMPASAATSRSVPCGVIEPGQRSSCQTCSSCEVVREIDDPHTGQHWILMRDPARPAGPGVLMLQGAILNDGGLEAAIVQVHAVIRAGDRVSVEQSNAKFDLSLGGIALYPAAQGALLKVRLETSGKVVSAAALGPGRTQLIPDKEFQP
jgi:hypothetical protein